MKRLPCLLMIAVLLLPGVWTARAEPIQLSPYQDSQAYKNYQRRPKSDLSKLIYVMDRFRNTDYIVIYDKVEYDSAEALKQAKAYIAKHYKNEDAVKWVQENAYRSYSGKTIYLKAPDGETHVLRDALIEELQHLE